MKGFCVNPYFRLIGRRRSNVVKRPRGNRRYFFPYYVTDNEVSFRIVLVNTNVVGNYCVNFK